MAYQNGGCATTDIQSLIDRRDGLKGQLLAVGDLPPGTLVEHYRKCGKANCRCVWEGERGHGPSWLLSRTVKGRSKSFRIPAGEVDEARRLVAEHQRFRTLLSEARRLAGRNGGGAPKRGRWSPRSRRSARPRPGGRSARARWTTSRRLRPRRGGWRLRSWGGRRPSAQRRPPRRVLREAERRGFDRAARQAVLCDGVAWIWNFANEHFPDAIQIVDVFHAKQHLFDTAKAIHGLGADLADAWGRQRRDELDQGRIDDLIAELGARADSREAARRDRQYFSRNRQRMRYPEFRSMGLCVATGVVEGGCKSIVAGRLNQAGMYWTVNGANAIIALRCAVESNRFDDFWERRAAKTA